MCSLKRVLTNEIKEKDMTKYNQKKLKELIREEKAGLLLNNSDVYALGLLYGQFLQADALGYNMSNEELREYTAQYEYLRTAYKSDDTGTIHSNRLDIAITYLKRPNSLSFTADGVAFRCNYTGAEFFCTEIVIEDEVEFESLCFFYNDWLDDVMEAVLEVFEVNEHSIKYELFACGTAKDLKIM